MQSTSSNGFDASRGVFRAGMMAAGAAVLVLLSGASLSGCVGRGSSGSGPGGATVGLGASGAGGQGAAAASRFAGIDADAWRVSGYRPDWTGYPFSGLGSGRIREVQAFGDAVVAQHDASNVSVLNASTGQLRWSLELTNPLTRFAGIVRDPVDPARLVVASESEIFLMSMGTGSLLAREPLSRVVNTAPVADGSYVIFGTSTGEIYAHHLGTQLKAWGFGAQGPIEVNLTRVGNLVAGVSQQGDVVLLNPQRGSLEGRARTYGAQTSSPVGDESGLYVASRDQSVWAFSPSGVQRWRYRTPAPITAQPFVHANVLYVTVPGAGLTALRTSDGSEAWKNADVTGEVIAVRAGRLLVWNAPSSGDATITVVEPRDGSVVGSFAAPGVTRLVPDAPVDGNLYAVTNTNVIVKLIPR